MILSSFTLFRTSSQGEGGKIRQWQEDKPHKILLIFRLRRIEFPRYLDGMVVKKTEIEISTQVNPVRLQTGNLADGKRSR